ncbi:MAG: hypothetical protein K9M02_20780, partial [Thiohalocapsa sp.]|nr:hypothetical protein [Thiohalocapsa sp.]
MFEHLAGSARDATPDDALHYPIMAAAPAKNQPTDTSMASKANLKSSGREAALARRRALSGQGNQGLRTNTAERTR